MHADLMRTEFLAAATRVAADPRTRMPLPMLEPTPAAEPQPEPAAKACRVCGGPPAFHDVYCVNCRNWMQSYGRGAL